MPKLGAYTEDVLLSEWLAAEGAEVGPGDVVFTLETDKTTAEVEAETAGFLHRLVAAGEKVPIGARVGLILATREEYEALAVADEDGNPFLGYIGHGGGAASHRAAEVSPAAPRPPATAGPSRAGAAPLVSPRARRLLADSGYSLERAGEIRGSGPGGRIVDRDVAAWIDVQARTEQPAAPRGIAVASRIPLGGRRGTIAARMLSSLQTTAQLTSVLEIDVEPLVALRRQLNEGGASPRIGVTSILAKLVATALREHPILNSRVAHDEIEVVADVNIAIAVDTPDGVVAPVVHRADTLSLEEINSRITDLAERARSGTLTPDDVADGTFTLSNGGIYPVDITTAILNPPQSALLWIGRIRERAVVVGGGAIAARPVLQACLTYDHRVVDGGPAAAFLATLESLVAGLRPSGGD
jgi:pyruvate/2-oxoglutarate dehydrogenase complex dihydrolipoamide acyltransferase (E2) component